MIDFDSLKNKAEEFVEQHEDQIDKGIGKAAGMAGQKFGHASEINAAARKLEDLTPDEDEHKQGHAPGHAAGHKPGHGAGHRPGHQQ